MSKDLHPSRRDASGDHAAGDTDREELGVCAAEVCAEEAGTVRGESSAGVAAKPVAGMAYGILASTCRDCASLPCSLRRHDIFLGTIPATDVSGSSHVGSGWEMSAVAGFLPCDPDAHGCWTPATPAPLALWSVAVNTVEIAAPRRLASALKASISCWASRGKSGVGAHAVQCGFRGGHVRQ